MNFRYGMSMRSFITMLASFNETKDFFEPNRKRASHKRSQKLFHANHAKNLLVDPRNCVI